MKVIDKWKLFHGRRIRGEVDGASFVSRAILKVDPSQQTVLVQGGETFKLGEKDSEEALSVDDLAKLIDKIREPGVVR